MISISIIIPVYNAGKYLFDTLESVRKQTLTDWECICINDGSTDQSALVIKQFADNDNRFKLIEQSNQGVSVSRNTGLDNANGKYIAFLDQDDLMPPTALENMFILAEKYNLNLVRGRRKNIPEDYPMESLKYIKSTKKHKIITHINVLKFRLLPRRWMYVWLCLFRRDFLTNIRFYEPLKSGAEDNIFMFEVFHKLDTFAQSRNYVCLHRKSLTSTTQNGFKLSHINTIELAVFKFKELTSAKNNNLSRFIYKKQMRNFFHGSVYKAIESKQYIPETQQMLSKIYPDIKPVIKIKHKIIAHLFLRNKIRVAEFLKRVLIV